MARLEPGMARIRIKNLRLRTYIGINEDEIRNKQDILINVTLFYPAEDAVHINDINHALNYRTITKEIIQYVEGKSLCAARAFNSRCPRLRDASRTSALRRSRSRQAARTAFFRVSVNYSDGTPQRKQ